MSKSGELQNHSMTGATKTALAHEKLSNIVSEMSNAGV